VTVYSVYEPPFEADGLDDPADGLAFVKDGFSWPALLLPGFWLIYQRMWIELIAFVALLGLLGWLTRRLHRPRAAVVTTPAG